MTTMLKQSSQNPMECRNNDWVPRDYNLIPKIYFEEEVNTYRAQFFITALRWLPEDIGEYAK